MKFKEAIEIMNKASAVILTSENGSPLMYASIQDDESTPDGEFLEFKWSDEDGYEFEIQIREKNNENVEVKHKLFHFIDIEGNEVTICPLKCWFETDPYEYESVHGKNANI